MKRIDHGAESDEPRSPSSSLRLLADLDHEMREPLTDLLGMTRQLLGAELPPAARQQAAIAHSAAEVLLYQLEGMGDVLQLESGDLEPRISVFGLRELLGRTTDSLAPLALAKGLQLDLEISDRLPDRFEGDAKRLRQVLFGLARHALQVTDDGFVRISVELKDHSQEHCRLRFSVRDTGPGATPEAQMQLLNEGSYLGLSLCRRLVEQLGGEIVSVSRPGLGSSFWFELELQALESADETWPGTAQGVKLEETTGAGKSRILVVEDEPINRLLAVSELEALGFAVDAVPNGREALRTLSGRSYDLVLMDCQMPELDGYEATRRIRRREAEGGRIATRGSRVPIVAMTAHAMAENRERCLECGMDGFLAKPFLAEELQQTLERWLGGAGEVPASKESSASDSDVLDPEVIAKLRGIRSRTGESLVIKAARRFLEELPGRLGRLRSAFETGDFSKLGDGAHAFKGASGMLGAIRLHQCCAELESVCREGLDDRVGPALAAVERTSAQVRLALEEIVSASSDR